MRHMLVARPCLAGCRAGVSADQEAAPTPAPVPTAAGADLVSSPAHPSCPTGARRAEVQNEAIFRSLAEVGWDDANLCRLEEGVRSTVASGDAVIVFFELPGFDTAGAQHVGVTGSSGSMHDRASAAELLSSVCLAASDPLDFGPGCGRPLCCTEVPGAPILARSFVFIAPAGHTALIEVWGAPGMRGPATSYCGSTAVASVGDVGEEDATVGSYRLTLLRSPQEQALAR